MIGARLSREEVEDGIFEAIRKQVVAAGYLPDSADIDTSAPDGGAAEWITAKETLRASLADKMLIEVFGPGTPLARDDAKMNIIYINRYQRRRGNVKGGFEEFVKVDNDPPPGYTYTKVMLPDWSTDLVYDVRYYTDSTKYDRIIEELLLKALGDQRTIPGIKADGTPLQAFWLTFETDVDLSAGKYFERLFRYTAQDLWLIEPEVITEAIAPQTTTLILGADEVVNILPE